jgi:hypothetical protein
MIRAKNSSTQVLIPAYLKVNWRLPPATYLYYHQVRGYYRPSQLLSSIAVGITIVVL